jgi:hypothetical protein
VAHPPFVRFHRRKLRRKLGTTGNVDGNTFGNPTHSQRTKMSGRSAKCYHPRMISPITIPCLSCGKSISLQVVGSQLPERADCFACKNSIHLVEPLGNIPAMLIMERAKWELNNKDITMAVLLSAMAVEAQMSWLFFKWRGIDDRLLPHEQTQAYKEKWEKEWTDMRTVSKRSDELSRLLTGKEFDKFAQQNMGWLKRHLD